MFLTDKQSTVMLKKFLLGTILVGIIIVFFHPLAFAQYYQVYHTTIDLKPIPLFVHQGDHITFSGTLYTTDEKKPLSERTVFIQHDSPYDSTRTLASTTTDSNGDFKVTWTAITKRGSVCTYNFFVKFNGDDNDYWSISKQFLIKVAPNSG